MFRLIRSLVFLIPLLIANPALAHDDLMEAVFRGQIKTLTFYLDHGADVNFQDKRYGASVLQVASQRGRKEVVTLLLERGAKVDLEDKEGSTALMAAAYNGHVDIVEILVDAGADVNHKNMADETALSLAREERRKSVISLLLQAGARDIAKRCPNPNVKYEDWSVQVYWQWYVAGYITEQTQTNESLCAKYSYQDQHSIQRGSVLFSLEKLDSRKEKEAGLVNGFKIFYAMNESSLGLSDELRKHYRVNTIFMERHAPRFETLTGLQFATAIEWFNWLRSNKDRLALSSDGKYVVER